MADQKISVLTELAETPASADEFVVVDKSDTTMGATGTNKRVQAQYLTIADATASVKGKSLLAEGQIHSATGKTTPVDADELGLVDSAASYVLKRLTWENVKATLKTYFDTLYPPKDGWNSVSDSWAYASADEPTFTITVPTGAASIYGVGMRIKLTQTTVKYFIITAVADTVLKVYGGTDYTLANAAISAISYSTQKAPLGFPLAREKWTYSASSTSDQNKTTPANGTWENTSTVTLAVPIGAWDLGYSVNVRVNDTTTATYGMQTTLSTANNSESDVDFTCAINGSASSSQFGTSMANRRKSLSVASKTTYYLNTRVTDTGVDSYNIRGTVSKTIVDSVCAYL